LVPVKSR